MAHQIEIDARDIFIGMSVILHNMRKNIAEGKTTYAQMEAVIVEILPEVAQMVLEHESPEVIEASTKRFSGLLGQIAMDKGIEIA
ncbi:MAG: hypothetical protein KU37_08125 [Sulfuricurvum sp. PC08-66]|nr:MAG: hypothetical protein KU37_08125 [Sulfuricurvum sp. PC08-66]